MNSIKEKDQQYIAGTYARFPVALTEGKGSRVWDDEGKEYIDMGSGIAVTAFGFGDSLWQKAVAEQAGKLQHTSNLYYTEPCAELARMLCEKTGMKKVFFGNSGAEANECAIKVARKYAAEKKGKDVYYIVTLKNSFHGRTLTTLAATGQEHYHELFQPLTPGFLHCDSFNLDELRAILAGHKVAAVLFEMVQGEGGVLPVDKEFVQEAAALCKQKDILFMVDEVQTGNGRTGTLYAYMQYGITPDVVTTAKGLGGGLPIGACLLGEKVENVLGFGDHGSTFGGNPVCAAGACSILSRLDEPFLAGVREKGEYIKKVFTGAVGVKEVSGLGLMVGILPEKAQASDIVKKCLQKGVLCLTAKNKVRLLPALNIPMEDLKEACDIILSVLKEG